MRKHQQFSASFCTLIQDDPDNTEVELNFYHDEADKHICVALNDVNTETNIQMLLKAEELIKENKYLANRLKTLKQNVKTTSKLLELSLDQLELLRINERCNHVI